MDGVPAPFLVGRLLLAVPTLPDPNFDRAVVLILDHDDEGAVGVILNRPTDTELPDRLPEWRALAADPRVVFVGGPVGLDAAIGLARAGETVATPGFSPLLGSIGTVDLGRDPTAIGPPIETVRVFAGYAGWSAGQLEGEVGGGDWIVLDARPDDVFTAEPEDLWQAVLRRQGGNLARLSRFPPDLSMN
jgi:putative transcriptional regulator